MTDLAAEEPITLSLEPKLSIPLGPFEDPATPFYSVGGGTDLVGRFLFPFLKPVSLQVMLGVELLPVNGTAANFTVLSLGAGGGVELDIGNAFYAGAAGFGGYWYGFFPGPSSETVSDGSFFAGASAEFGYKVSDELRIGIGVSYRHHFYPSGGIYDGLAIGLTGGLKIRSGGGVPLLKIDPVLLEPVFPVFYSYYNDNPLGRLTVTNGEPGEIREVAVQIFVPQYMEKPKLCATIASIPEGAAVEVPLYGLFTDRVLEITEGTKVTATISVEYLYGGKKRLERNDVLYLNNRNAMTWDDDRRAAAFVTAKDPAVLKFARNVDSAVKSLDDRELNQTFRQGIAIAESIALLGVRYAVDPATPFSKTSANALAVDYLQFPAQTLSYKAGDCDDLSILYCSLMEALGVKAAFITVPGHIYAAFGLGMGEAEARKYYNSSESLIYADGETWVPVEVTILDKGFAAACQKGAEEWRQYNPDGKADLSAVRDSWKLYAPVGIKSNADDIPTILPRLETVYRESLKRMTDVFIGAEEKRLQGILGKNSDNPAARNLLGVLYAKFGLYEKAENEFSGLIEESDAFSALVNLANIRVLQGRNEDALVLFRRAEKKIPDNSAVIIGEAKALYALGKPAEARELYAKIASMDGELAEKYAYLANGNSEGNKASFAGIIEDALWSEE